MLRKLCSTLGTILSHPLNANDRLASLLNYASWQIGSRIINKRVIIPWIDDAVFVSKNGETGITGNIYTGLIEFEEMSFLMHALSQNDIFVDVGANVGAYTIIASKVVKARTIAFEPSQEAIERLNDQITINKIDFLVKVVNKGASDENGECLFTTGNDTTNRISFDNNEFNQTKIKTTKLDDELDTNDFYIIKIDVEGYEYKVISGLYNILNNQKVIAFIIEINGNGEIYGFGNDQLHQKIQGFGFIPVAYDPFNRSVIEIENYNKERTNTIYVKDLDFVSTRCRLSPKRCVHTARGLYL